MNLSTIRDIILDEASTQEALREALDTFVLICSEITNIQPDRSFDAWAEDSLLDNGVAINPGAAALCTLDYTRSVVFMRGVYAAINTLRLHFPDSPLEVLYAGCGPFATLLLPLLGRFPADELRLYLLDYHQDSLDSVELLLIHFGFDSHDVQTIKADACNYQHAGKLHLIVAETMQKSLEQEPQFAVTANLAPQLCPLGVFLPQRIDVALCLADLERERVLFSQSQAVAGNELVKSNRRYTLATVCTLSPEHAFEQVKLAQANSAGAIPQLEPTIVEIPVVADVARLDAALFTHICVFQQYQLTDYESQITLPLKCYELMPLIGGNRYRVSYQLGSYPRFQFDYLEG